jgi:hypothetical protein
MKTFFLALLALIVVSAVASAENSYKNPKRAATHATSSHHGNYRHGHWSGGVWVEDDDVGYGGDACDVGVPDVRVSNKEGWNALADFGIAAFAAYECEQSSTSYGEGSEPSNCTPAGSAGEPLTIPDAPYARFDEWETSNVPPSEQADAVAHAMAYQDRPELRARRFSDAVDESVPDSQPGIWKIFVVGDDDGDHTVLAWCT